MSEAMMKVLMKNIGLNPEEIMETANKMVKALESRMNEIQLNLVKSREEHFDHSTRLDAIESQLNEIRISLTILAEEKQREMDDLEERKKIYAQTMPVAGMGEQLITDEDELSDAVVDEPAPKSIAEIMPIMSRIVKDANSLAGGDIG